MKPTEHFGIYFGYIRRLFQSWVSPFNELNFATGCKPDAFRPTLCYIASINDHQEQAKFNNMGSATRHCRQGCRRRGVEGVRSPHFLKPRGTTPQKFWYFSIVFFLKRINLKWPQSEVKLNFEGMWVWVPMNPFPYQNFVRRP